MSIVAFPPCHPRPLRFRRMLLTMTARPHYRHGPLMRPSFAHIAAPLQVLLLGSVLALASCASLPPPTAELSAAQQAVSRADTADAQQYAPDELAAARGALRLAQAAMSGGNERDARSQALLAAAAADLAYARSRQALAESELAQRRAEVSSLRRSLGMEDVP